MFVDFKLHCSHNIVMGQRHIDAFTQLEAELLDLDTSKMEICSILLKMSVYPQYDICCLCLSNLYIVVKMRIKCFWHVYLLILFLLNYLLIYSRYFPNLNRTVRKKISSFENSAIKTLRWCMKILECQFSTNFIIKCFI